MAISPFIYKINRELITKLIKNSITVRSEIKKDHALQRRMRLIIRHFRKYVNNIAIHVNNL